MPAELIPFHVETGRILDLLAKQIYQSPFALLRENTQNAYDAILIRRRREPTCSSQIEIHLSTDEIRVVDDGVGMTPEEVRNNYWCAGRSGKNTDEARAAGVVGTFGIGAMANFGIAQELIVDTESASTGERSRSRATRENLSLSEDCVELETLDSRDSPGTEVTVRILPEHRLDVSRAAGYIADFVQLLRIPVMVNGDLLSRVPMEVLVQEPPAASRFSRDQQQVGPRLVADVRLTISANADIWVSLGNLVWSGQCLNGTLTLRSGESTLRTFRSGFGLATVGVGSVYQLGGIADLANLYPTAGREALTTDSMQFLQSLLSEIDDFVSNRLAEMPECDSSTPFMSWVVSRRRYDLCGRLRTTVRPGEKQWTLDEVKDRSESGPVLLYTGSDASFVERTATEDKPLLLLARTNPRRRCQTEFLKRFCETEEVSDTPALVRQKDSKDYSLAESALVYRLEAILDVDYFLKAHVVLGKITHGLPILTTKVDEKVRIAVDPAGATVSLVLGIYDTEYTAFGSMVKDFVRNVVFPSVAQYVPSSSRQGAEMFLRTIRKPREVFEYEETDLGELPEVWADYQEGKITMAQAVQRSMRAVRTGVQVLDSRATARFQDVMPDVVQNDELLRGVAAESESLEAAPAISRTELSSRAKLLTIGKSDPSLHGYRCFLSITDQAREERGEFFFQPHKTSVVWGGQRVLFILLHHSERFGLYYDLQTQETLASEGGGGPFPTCSIVLKDNIYLPVPEAIVSRFVPEPSERKRFYVRHDLLRVSDSLDTARQA